HMSAERVPRAQALVLTVKDLLTRDEHVLPLARGLREAQVAAFNMLTDAVKPTTENSQRGIGLKDATAVFNAITKALAADPRLVLDIDWRLHPKDESVS